MFNFYPFFNKNFDKVLHFALLGFVPALVAYGVTAQNWRWGITTAFVFGLGKELWDWLIRKTKFDIVDLVVTIAGGCAAMGFIKVLGML